MGRTLTLLERGIMTKYDDEIAALRKEIDLIDSKILKLIEERVSLAEKIGHQKKEDDLPTEDIEREKQIISRLVSDTDLDRQFVSELFKAVIEYCKKNERKV